MHRLFVSAARGKALDDMWVSRVQTTGLSAASPAQSFGLWENLADFAQLGRKFSAAIHTVFWVNSYLLVAAFYPQSTGPIKSVTNLNKLIRS